MLPDFTVDSSFKCICYPGYEEDANGVCQPTENLLCQGKNCSEANGVKFCRVSQTNSSEAECFCPNGFYLAADKVTCKVRYSKPPFCHNFEKRFCPSICLFVRMSVCPSVRKQRGICAIVFCFTQKLSRSVLCIFVSDELLSSLAKADIRV